MAGQPQNYYDIPSVPQIRRDLTEDFDNTVGDRYFDLHPDGSSPTPAMQRMLPSRSNGLPTNKGKAWEKSALTQNKTGVQRQARPPQKVNIHQSVPRKSRAASTDAPPPVIATNNASQLTLVKRSSSVSKEIAKPALGLIPGKKRKAIPATIPITPVFRPLKRSASKEHAKPTVDLLPGKDKPVVPQRQADHTRAANVPQQLLRKSRAASTDAPQPVIATNNTSQLTLVKRSVSKENAKPALDLIPGKDKPVVPQRQADHRVVNVPQPMLRKSRAAPIVAPQPVVATNNASKLPLVKGSSTVNKENDKVPFWERLSKPKFIKEKYVSSKPVVKKNATVNL